MPDTDTTSPDTTSPDTTSPDAAAAATGAVVRAAIEAGLVGADVPLCGLLDLQGVAAQAARLVDAFSGAAHVTHTFAAKANSLVPVLRLFRTLGFGCEVASPGELACARAAGFDGQAIVYDGPAKTWPDLREAVALGVALNADNFQELARLDQLVGGGSPGTFGLRVNPVVGGGSIDAMSTATDRSKFGVPASTAAERDQIVQAFRDRPWLTRLHVHVGSQGCPLPLIASGIASTRLLADQINEALGARQVTSLDVGGGLPVNFDGPEARPSFADYVEELQRSVPGLLDGPYHLLTEFGRALTAKQGMILATVQYTKQSRDRWLALTLAGGQVATRTVLMPDDWPLRASVFDHRGQARIAPASACVPLDVAGPLCFAGDLVARGRPLPATEQGDVVALHDTGAYYLHHHWSYNGFPRPAVHGYVTDADGHVTFTTLRQGQTADDVAREHGSALPPVDLGRS